MLIRRMLIKVLNLDIKYIKRIIVTLYNKVLDKIYVFKLPINLDKVVVIFHGASCSGKSYYLRWLSRKYNGFRAVEMDRYLHSKIKPNPEFIENAFNKLSDSLFEHLIVNFINPEFVNEKSNRLEEIIRSSDLLDGKNPRYVSMIELFKESLINNVVICTCGDLPPPRLDNGYYRLLGNYTSKVIIHVLIGPNNEVLKKRIKFRGREQVMEKWLESNRRRISNKKYYDILLNGVESISDVVESINEAVIKKRNIKNAHSDSKESTIIDNVNNVDINNAM